MSIKVGTKVRVKDNAPFDGADPRGKTGTVVADFIWNVVALDDGTSIDGKPFLLTDDELEVVA